MLSGENLAKLTIFHCQLKSFLFKNHYTFVICYVYWDIQKYNTLSFTNTSKYSAAAY